MAKVLSTEDIERLREIKDEIKELLNEAYRTVEWTSEGRRAKAYWYAHMVTALDSDHGYLGGSMCTMEESIEALDSQIGDLGTGKMKVGTEGREFEDGNEPADLGEWKSDGRDRVDFESL